MTRPGVSIVLPTFERAHLLSAAIDSVLAQTCKDWELVIVDDGSSDGTSRVAGRYRDRRIRYVRQEHRGRSAARNRGIELTQAPLVAFLDSDDQLLPGALAAQRRPLDACSEVGMTVAGYERIDADGNPIGVRTPWTEGGELTCEGWLLNCYGIHGTTLVRRAWLERVGGFRSEHDLAEDWDLFSRLAVEGCPMAWVPELVCQYRRHEGSSTRQLEARLAAALSMLDSRSQDPRLPAIARASIPRAKAWALASSAREAAELGDDGHVRRALGLARDVGAIPRWRRGRFSASPEGFESLVEPLAACLDARLDGNSSQVSRAARWGLSVRELRRARARVEMASFFSALELGQRTGAAQHLRRALRQDPRWLANRAVVGYLLRRAGARR